MRSLTYFFSTILIFLLSFKTLALCDLPTTGKLAIQQNGRVKPLYVHANELIKHITGKKKISDYNATEAFCRLSLK